MVLDAVAAVETCQTGLLDNPLEIAIISTAQNPGKLTAGPNLRSRIVRLIFSNGERSTRFGHFCGRAFICWHKSFRNPEPLVSDDLFAPFDQSAGRGMKNAKPSGQFHRAEVNLPHCPVAQQHAASFDRVQMSQSFLSIF